MSVRDVVLRQVYRLAYRALMLYAIVLRPHARGVKCLLSNRGDVLLVRHTYGPRRRWHVPGGGVRRREAPLAAAAREMREELGLRELRFTDLGEVRMRLDRRMVAIACVHAELPDRAIDPHRAEIAEARWFAPEALPSPLGGEVRQVVGLLDRGR